MRPGGVCARTCAKNVAGDAARANSKHVDTRIIELINVHLLIRRSLAIADSLRGELKDRLVVKIESLLDMIIENKTGGFSRLVVSADRHLRILSNARSGTNAAVAALRFQLAG